MADRLAGLVLPDSTPVEDLPEEFQAEPRKAAPVKPVTEKRDKSDLIFALAGIALATLCAVFPWYIFFNQDEFGIRPLAFSGAGDTGSEDWPAAGELTPADWADVSVLDFRATGTISPTQPEMDGALHQPFPGDLVPFRLIDAANGRAIIEDKDGFWIVERGSALPDGSRVSDVVRSEDGSWVLVTSDDRTIPLCAESTQGPRKTGRLSSSQIPGEQQCNL